MLRQLFESGYFVSSIAVEIADRMLAVLENRKFMAVKGVDVHKESPDFKDVNLMFPDVWSDNDGNLVQAFDNWDYPQELVDIWEILKNKYFTNFQEILGYFDHSCMLSHNFSVGQQLGFHSDTTEATFFGAVAYLGDSDFIESDGGYLRVGRAKLNSKGEPYEIQELEKIIPNHGTIVILNNIDPTFVHAVEPLKVKKRRMTQACRFGFSNQRYAFKKSDRGGYS